MNKNPITKTAPNPKQSIDELVNPASKKHRKLIDATVKPYGICVETWST